MKAIFSYCINARTVCLLAFACASIAVAACCIIWLFAKLLVSVAKSASCILPLAEDKFTAILSRFAIVEVNRFDKAPNSPRRVDTNDIASSIKLIALAALVAVSTPPVAPIFVASKSLKVCEIVTPYAAPTWNVTAELVPKLIPPN